MFFRMFAASLGALRIEAATLPASSPGTKRGGEPWLLIHFARNVGSLPIASLAQLSNPVRLVSAARPRTAGSASNRIKAFFAYPAICLSLCGADHLFPS